MHPPLSSRTIGKMTLDALQLKSPVPELAVFQLTRFYLRSRWNRKNFPDLAHMAFNLLLTPLKRLNQRNRRSFLISSTCTTDSVDISFHYPASRS